MPAPLDLDQASALREWLRAVRALNPSLPWPSDGQLEKIPAFNLPTLPEEGLEPALFEQRAQLDDQAHDNLEIMITKADTILSWIVPELSIEDRRRFFDESFRSFGLLDPAVTMDDAKKIAGYEKPPTHPFIKRRRS